MAKSTNDLNTLTKENMLFEAIENNDYNTAWKIIDGFPVLVDITKQKSDDPIYCGITPLHCAVMKGHLEMTILLIEKKSNVNAKDNNEYTPLHIAATKGYFEIVSLLIEKGAIINVDTVRSLNSPLEQATYHGHLNIVKLLIEKGANVNKKGFDEGNALQSASIMGHTEIAKLLIEKGANVNSQDRFKKSPIYWATTNGRIKIVKLLIENNADVNIKNCYGQSPIYRTVKVEIFKLLIEAGAELDESIMSGRIYNEVAKLKEIADQALELKPLMQVIKNLFIRNAIIDQNAQNDSSKLFKTDFKGDSLQQNGNTHTNSQEYYEMAKGYFHYLLAKEMKKAAKIGVKELQNLLDIVYKNIKDAEIFNLISYQDLSGKIITLAEHFYQSYKLEKASICLANGDDNKISDAIFSLQTLAMMQVSKILKEKQITEEEKVEKLSLDVINKINDFENAMNHIGDTALETSKNDMI